MCNAISSGGCVLCSNGETTYDRLPLIRLEYLSKTEKAVSALHTPDYFAIGHNLAAWAECKPKENLLKPTVS
jgi:hypothetical protein